MTTLQRGQNWKISVYGREHGIAHVHVTGADFRAVVAIEAGDILAGKLPASVLQDVREWLRGNQAQAFEQWTAHNPDL